MQFTVLQAIHIEECDKSFAPIALGQIVYTKESYFDTARLLVNVTYRPISLDHCLIVIIRLVVVRVTQHLS